MKINHNIETPKYEFDDYSRAEQKLMMLMGGVRGTYNTDYFGMEKAISIRTNAINTPKIDALSELSGLSKNIVVNDLLELAFHVLQENLNEEDSKRFSEVESKKMEDWLAQYQEKESK